MARVSPDEEVAHLQKALEELAIACLELLSAKDETLTELERYRLRNIARRAITRAIDLPGLAERDRTAWLRRTKQFIGAITRLVLKHLDVRVE